MAKYTGFVVVKSDKTHTAPVRTKDNKGNWSTEPNGTVTVAQVEDFNANGIAKAIGLMGNTDAGIGIGYVKEFTL